MRKSPLDRNAKPNTAPANGAAGNLQADAIAAPESQWFFAWLKSAMLYLSMATAYLIAVTALVAAWRKFVAEPGDRIELTICAVAGVLALPLLLALLFNLLPALRRRRERMMRPTGKGEEGYFITGPREDDPYGLFHEGYEPFLNWARDPQSPLLHLTGLSGSGKSSILSAYLRPKLAEAEPGPSTQLIVIRSYHDPLAELKRELLRFWVHKPDGYDALTPLESLRRAARQLKNYRLLVAFDQFEEFFILRVTAGTSGRASLSAVPEAELAPLREFLQSFRADPPHGVAVLLSYRDDYHRFLAPLDLPAREDRKNWMTIDPLDFAAAAGFLRSCPGLRVPEERMDRVLHEAARQEGGRVLMRPIVANLLGLILCRMSGHPTLWRRSGDLLRGYVREELGQESTEGRASVLRSLLTDFHTARPRAAAEIAEEARLDAAVVSDHLEHLGRAGLLRCVNRGEPDRDQRIWQVAHDFLATLVERVLDGVHRTLWRCIRPWAATATLVGLLALAIFGWVDLQRRNEARDQEAARDILAEVGNQEADVQDLHEEAAIWSLAQAPDRVKVALLGQALTPGNALRFSRRSQWIVQSAIGLNPDIRQKVIEQVWVPVDANASADPEVALASGLLGREMGVCEFAPNASIPTLVGGIQKTTDPDVLRCTAAVFTALARHPEDVGAALDQLTDTAKGTTDPNALHLVAEVLKATRERDSLRPAQAAFGRLLDATRDAADYRTVCSLAEIMEPLAERLSPEYAQTAFDRLLDLMPRTQDANAQRAQGQALARITERLGPGAAGAAFDRLLESVRRCRLAGEHCLADALKAASNKLTTGEAAARFNGLVDALTKLRDPEEMTTTIQGAVRDRDLLSTPDLAQDHVSCLEVVLRDVVVKLGPEHASAAFDRLLAAWPIRNSVLLPDSVILGGALKSLAARLGPADAGSAADRLLDAMKESAAAPTLHFILQGSAAPTLHFIAQGLAGLPVRPPPEKSKVAFVRLVNVMQETTMQKITDFHQLYLLADGVRAVPGELGPDLSKAAFGCVLRAVSTPVLSSANIVRVLADALAAIPGDLDSGQVDVAFDWLFRATQTTNDPNVLRSLTAAMVTMARRMTPEQLWAAFNRLSAAVQSTMSPARLDSLGEVLVTITGRLQRDRGPEAFVGLLALIERTIEPDVTRHLIEALRVLPLDPDPRITMVLLKRPTSFGGTRKALLGMLERAARPEAFDGDLWKAVQWADTQRDTEGRPVFDLRSPPRRQIQPIQ
jgi:hypothetical protein